MVCSGFVLRVAGELQAPQRRCGLLWSCLLSAASVLPSRRCLHDPVFRPPDLALGADAALGGGGGEHRGGSRRPPGADLQGNLRQHHLLQR